MHRKILIAIDATEVSRPAVAEGIGIAKALGAEVVFYYVLPNFVLPFSEIPVTADLSPAAHYREAKKVAGELLRAAASRALRAGVESSEAMGSGGVAAECIVKAARKRKCDLIVVGSHGRTAVQRFLFGSVVTQLITLSPVPVLVCKKGAPRTIPSGNVTRPSRPPRLAARKTAAILPPPLRRPRRTVAA